MKGNNNVILPLYGRLNDKMKWMMSVLFTLLFFPSSAQQTVKLNLKETIELANDSSLSAFRYQNMYLSGYWEYRTYKANRLPSLTLNLAPAQYYRYITQRYDSNTDMDVYREQQMFSAGAGFAILLFRSVWGMRRACWDTTLSDGTGR